MFLALAKILFQIFSIFIAYTTFFSCVYFFFFLKKRESSFYLRDLDAKMCIYLVWRLIEMRGKNLFFYEVKSWMKSIWEIFLLYEIISKTSLQSARTQTRRRRRRNDDENFFIAHAINDAAVREHERGNFLLFILIFMFYIYHTVSTLPPREWERENSFTSYTRCAAHRRAKRKWKLPFYFCLFSRLAFLCVIVCVCFNLPLFCAIIFFLLYTFSR